MTVKEFAQKTGMKVLAGADSIEKEVTGVYVCDLLSWVISHAGKGNAWITVHTNLNIVAVAMLAEVSCIIIPEGIPVEEATLKRADQEGVIILGTDMSAYEVCANAAKYFEKVYT
ncbi:MAG TPA: AraC family transcriptional regulator [Clostridiaceae bacterium]|nr:AraC family transcriptional regulator [Clostridiaceae bacterium]